VIFSNYSAFTSKKLASSLNDNKNGNAYLREAIPAL